jgi:hypothetical protein
MGRRIAAALVGIVASLLLASTALASHCVNASKSDQTAGAQVVLNAVTGEIVWATTGLTTRVEQGLVDPVTGEGFHGLVALDFDGDGVGDVSTWFGVGPDGQALPDQAIGNGPACRGITDIGTYLTQCLGG